MRRICIDVSAEQSIEGLAMFRTNGSIRTNAVALGIERAFTFYPNRLNAVAFIAAYISLPVIISKSSTACLTTSTTRL